MLSFARNIINGIIAFFYKPFSRWIPWQTFRYLACGGSNTLLNIVLYSASLKWLFTSPTVHVSGFTIASSIAAGLVSFCVTFPLGFILSRYIVFPESTLSGRVQFFRYVMIVAMFFLLSYVLIKVSDTVLNWMALKASYALVHSVAYVFIQAIMAVLSYILQRVFTFKTAPEEVIEEMVDAERTVQQ